MELLRHLPSLSLLYMSRMPSWVTKFTFFSFKMAIEGMVIAQFSPVSKFGPCVGLTESYLLYFSLTCHICACFKNFYSKSMMINGVFGHQKIEAANTAHAPML